MHNVNVQQAWDIIHNVWNYMMSHGIDLTIGTSTGLHLSFGVIAIGVLTIDIVNALISKIWWGN